MYRTARLCYWCFELRPGAVQYGEGSMAVEEMQQVLTTDTVNDCCNVQEGLHTIWAGWGRQ